LAAVWGDIASEIGRELGAIRAIFAQPELIAGKGVNYLKYNGNFL
jgi:hypothetical protein